MPACFFPRITGGCIRVSVGVYGSMTIRANRRTPLTNSTVRGPSAQIVIVTLAKNFLMCPALHQPSFCSLRRYQVDILFSFAGHHLKVVSHFQLAMPIIHPSGGVWHASALGEQSMWFLGYPEHIRGTSCPSWQHVIRLQSLIHCLCEDQVLPSHHSKALTRAPINQPGGSSLTTPMHLLSSQDSQAQQLGPISV